jgi:hypothetical protein
MCDKRIKELIERLEKYPANRRVLLLETLIGYGWSDCLWGDLEDLMTREEDET